MLHLYNTLTRKIEKFQPLKDKKIGFYACGPTVYNFAHLGNLRTYIFEDVLRRALKTTGFRVKHVMNITDVDDKTIKASQEASQTLKDFTAFYANAFKKDIKKLNILSPTLFAPATHYLKPMVALVQKLLKKGIAYEKNGSIYFSLKKFSTYGRLARLDKQELKVGARVDVDNYEKDNPADFVLWKKWTPKDGKIFWQTALGKGRPGWHLECSVIATQELGQPFDIHAGGVDLIFPHHENEIAQAEASSGKLFAKYWLHGEHLLVEGQKMAKSLNNFFTLQNLEDKGFNPLAFRYLILTAHYRAKLNFTWESLRASQNALESLFAMIRDWDKPKKDNCAEFETEFFEAIENDLDTPRALAIMWEMIKSPLPSSAKARSLLKFDEILGLDIKKYLAKEIKVPIAIKKLAVEREKARQQNNWSSADKLRQEIARRGFEIKDTPTGPSLYPILSFKENDHR